jgi:hypothetical protein
MNYFQGMIGPIGVLAIIVSYFLITITALILILKKEKGLEIFLWLLIIFLLPYLGGLVYLLKNFLNRNTNFKNA